MDEARVRFPTSASLHARLAQSVEHKTLNLGVAGSTPALGCDLVVCVLVLPNWRNGSAPAYGAGGCGFEPHVGLVCG